MGGGGGKETKKGLYLNRQQFSSKENGLSKLSEKLCEKAKKKNRQSIEKRVTFLGGYRVGERVRVNVTNPHFLG